MRSGIFIKKRTPDAGVREQVNDMYDVTALGELLIDFAAVSADPDGYPTVAAHPGGAPANYLAALGKFGAKTAFIGKVGNDGFGKMLAQTLRKSGIDTKGLVMADDVFTTLAFVTFDSTGDRSFSFARKPGADTQLRFEEIDLSLIDDCRVFHFGSLSLTDEPARSATHKAVEYARSKGKLISCDPNYREPLWNDGSEARAQIEWGLHQADIIKVSDEEVEFLWGLSPEQGLEKLASEYDAELIFVTCGADGCLYKNRNACGKLPALKGIKVIDTCGAGDIFGGSAMWKLLQTGKRPRDLTDAELKDIVTFACTAAGISATRPGGISSIPALDEVMKTL